MQITIAVKDLAMLCRDNNSWGGQKKKANSDKKYFNCYTFGHYIQNCTQIN